MLKGRSILLSKNEKPMVVESKAAVSTG